MCRRGFEWSVALVLLAVLEEASLRNTCNGWNMGFKKMRQESILEPMQNVKMKEQKSTGAKPKNLKKCLLHQVLHNRQNLLYGYFYSIYSHK